MFFKSVCKHHEACRHVRVERSNHVNRLVGGVFVEGDEHTIILFQGFDVFRKKISPEKS